MYIQKRDVNIPFSMYGRCIVDLEADDHITKLFDPLEGSVRIEEIYGSGIRSRKLGTSAWPENNFVLYRT